MIEEVLYRYDVWDRRIQIWHDPDGSGPASADITWTVYDGLNPYADFDTSGSLTTRYLYGPAVDFLLARVDASGDEDWYLTDNLGSVRQIVDSDGTVLDRIDYDSYGNITAETNPAQGDRFKYTAREWDAAVDLYFYRARYYDPATGRFISEDPIGFAAGDANLNRYVENKPVDSTDPDGQQRRVQQRPNPRNRLIRPRHRGNRAPESESLRLVEPPPNGFRSWYEYEYYYRLEQQRLEREARRRRRPPREPSEAEVRSRMLEARARGSGDAARLARAEQRALRAGVPPERIREVLNQRAVTRPGGRARADAEILNRMARRNERMQEEAAMRARELQESIENPNARGQSTTAVAVGRLPNGRRVILISNSEGGSVRRGARERIRPGEILVRGRRGNDAEINIIEYARANGVEILTIGTSRAHCANCMSEMTAMGIAPNPHCNPHDAAVLPPVR